MASNITLRLSKISKIQKIAASTVVVCLAFGLFSVMAFWRGASVEASEPGITAVTPNSGSVGGGTELTITGVGFGGVQPSVIGGEKISKGMLLQCGWLDTFDMTITPFILYPTGYISDKCYEAGWAYFMVSDSGRLFMASGDDSAIEEIDLSAYVDGKIIDITQGLFIRTDADKLYLLLTNGEIKEMVLPDNRNGIKKVMLSDILYNYDGMGAYAYYATIIYNDGQLYRIVGYDLNQDNSIEELYRPDGCNVVGIGSTQYLWQLVPLCSDGRMYLEGTDTSTNHTLVDQSNLIGNKIVGVRYSDARHYVVDDQGNCYVVGSDHYLFHGYGLGQIACETAQNSIAVSPNGKIDTLVTFSDGSPYLRRELHINGIEDKVVSAESYVKAGDGTYRLMFIVTDFGNLYIQRFDRQYVYTSEYQEYYWDTDGDVSLIGDAGSIVTLDIDGVSAGCAVLSWTDTEIKCRTTAHMEGTVGVRVSNGLISFSMDDAFTYYSDSAEEPLPGVPGVPNTGM